MDTPANPTDPAESKPSTETDPSTETEPSTDRLFDVLSHARRRSVLYCLRQYENPMALADLADEVAVRENETVVADVPNEEVTRIYTSLYHSHVPKLENVGLVEYDQDRDTVALVEHADPGDTWLARLEELCGGG